MRRKIEQQSKGLKKGCISFFFFYSPTDQHPIYNCIQNVAFCFPVIETKQEFCFSPFVMHMNRKPVVLHAQMRVQFCQLKRKTAYPAGKVIFWGKKNK